MATTLEKMLRHAGERLVTGGHTGRVEMIALYQRFVRVEEHRLRILHRGGASGREIIKGRTAMIDVVVQRIFWDVRANYSKTHPGELPRLALVALGGYGRGELSPFSDVDIMFLHEMSLSDLREDEFLRAMVEGVLYLLWDVGFKIGYSCRSIKECLQMSHRDMPSMTSLIEARWLGGDQKIFELFEESLVNECVKKTVDSYIAARLRDQEERHARFGDSVFLQEPNVKNGCGGLRDFQNLIWMAYFKYGTRDLKSLEQKGFVTPSERKQLEVAYDFLLRVRNELHYLVGRVADVILMSFQAKIATHFGYRQHDLLRRIEAFMRDYYLHARNIFLLTNTLVQRLALKNPGLPEGRTLQAFLARRMKRDEKKDGFIFRGTMILAGSPKIFTEQPLRLMRVFHHVQVRHLDLSPDLRSLIRDHLVLVDRRFQRDEHAKEIFLAILSQKGEVGRILRMMHEVGFLGKYLPEFGRLTCLVQHEFYHRYTADEHTLLVIEKLDETMGTGGGSASNYRKLYHSLERPEILNLALLLHDTGRATNADHHAQASAKIAARVAEHWHLDSPERELLVFLVRQHFALSTHAQRRDLDDPEIVTEFARLVETPQRLDALHLMTFADSQVTGVVPLQWQEALRWELYDKTYQALVGSPETAEAQEQRLIALRKEIAERLDPEVLPEELEAHAALMPRRYWLASHAEEIQEHLALVHEFLRRQVFARNECEVLGPVIGWKGEPDRGHTRVTVCCWDRSRLFARIAGSFALAGINILSAQIYTRGDDIVLDTFQVTDASLGAIQNESALRHFEQILSQSLSQDVDLRGLILQQPPPSLPSRPEAVCVLTQVSVDNTTSRSRTIIEVQAEDRIGLLFAIADTISSLGLLISSAQITTEKGAALDSFYVVDGAGQKIESPSQLEAIRRGITEAVEKLWQWPEPQS